MKLTIEQDAACAEPEVKITCRDMDEGLLRIVAALRALDHKLSGISEGRTFVFEPDEIYYFESVDKRTFLYTADRVCETPLRLYELEGKLCHGDFFRASKSVIVNLSRIRMLNPMLGGKIEVVLENGERLMVSRQYVPMLKEKLGL